MINAISQRIANGIKATVPDHPVSTAVLKYSISFLLNSLSIIGLTLLISFFTGRIHEVVTALISFAFLRQVSGGYHLSSGIACILLSTAGVTALSFAQFGSNVIFTANVVSSILVLLFAPSGIHKQTRIPGKYYPYLKFIALMMVGLSFLINDSVISISFLVQSLTLIHKRR
jgi:accessory gene regulator B